MNMLPSSQYSPDEFSPPSMPAVRELMKVPEVAKFLRISKNLAYELIAQRRIPSLRFGRTIRVPRLELEAMIAAASTFKG